MNSRDLRADILISGFLCLSRCVNIALGVNGNQTNTVSLYKSHTNTQILTLGSKVMTSMTSAKMRNGLSTVMPSFSNNTADGTRTISAFAQFPLSSLYSSFSPSDSPTSSYSATSLSCLSSSPVALPFSVVSSSFSSNQSSLSFPLTPSPLDSVSLSTSAFSSITSSPFTFSASSFISSASAPFISSSSLTSFTFSLFTFSSSITSSFSLLTSSFTPLPPSPFLASPPFSHSLVLSSVSPTISYSSPIIRTSQSASVTTSSFLPISTQSLSISNVSLSDFRSTFSADSHRIASTDLLAGVIRTSALTKRLSSAVLISQTINLSTYKTSNVTLYISVVKTRGIKTSPSSYAVPTSILFSREIPTVIPKLLEFNGELVFSLKESSKERLNDLKRLADKIEDILDDVYKPVPGYLYSKVLRIKQKKEGNLECHFKLFLEKDSKETSLSLRERLYRYRNLSGFGDFTLHSAETSAVTEPSEKDSLKLWVIIVLAVLGVSCLLLVIALIYLLRRVNKMKTRKDFSPHHDNNSNKRYMDFTTVFDGIDETKNIPLKLSKPKASPSDSNKPLKSETTGTESETENEDGLAENGDVRKLSVQGSTSGSEGKDQGSDKEPDSPIVPLQIQDDVIDEDDDDTKFSTFSRKR